jgi:hypothetical protein
MAGTDHSSSAPETPQTQAKNYGVIGRGFDAIIQMYTSESFASNMGDNIGAYRNRARCNLSPRCHLSERLLRWPGQRILQ